jgi:hypothetical protein
MTRAMVLTINGQREVSNPRRLRISGDTIQDGSSEELEQKQTLLEGLG